MKRLFVVLISVFVLAACGDSGGMNEAESSSSVSAPVSNAPSSADLAFFYTRTQENIAEPFTAYSKAQVRLIVEGECEYEFNILEYDTGEVELPLGSGFGPDERIVTHEFPYGRYVIEAFTNCPWRMEIAQINTATGLPFDKDNDGGGYYYVDNSGSSSSNGGSSGGNSSSGSEGGPEYCQGCCSHHDGVVCVNGVTRCSDGSELTSTCAKKGCNMCN